MKLENKIAYECIISNKYIQEKKLVFQSFGNSSIRINKHYFVIKPSGIKPNKLKIKDMPIIKISDGKKIKGKLNPSVDTPIHQEIYKKFEKINSISHTHSKFATSWAQSCKNLPNLGTTHCDYFYDEIKNLPFLKSKKINNDYEKNIGIQICHFLKKLKDEFATPAVLLRGHGAFTWGRGFQESAINADILEYVAEMSFYTKLLGNSKPVPLSLRSKHFFRKHGNNAYYGQTKRKKI